MSTDLDILTALAGKVNPAEPASAEPPPTPAPPPANETPAPPVAPEPKVEVPSADPPKEPVFDRKQYLREFAQKAELGVEPDSEDDIIKVVSDWRAKAQKAEENPFANELVQKANDYAKQGGDIGFFLQSQTLDLDKMKAENPDELLFLHRKLTEGDILTDEQIRWDIAENLNAPTEDFGLSERDIKLREINKAKALAEATRFLKEWQVKSAVPQAEVERLNREAQMEAQARLYQERLEKAVNQGEVSFGAEKVKIEWADANGKPHPTAVEVKKAMEDPHGFIMDTFATDGVFDPAKIRDVVYILKNKDNIAAILEKKGQSAGVQEVINKVENPSTPGSDVRPRSKSQEEQSREDMAKFFFGR